MNEYKKALLFYKKAFELAPEKDFLLGSISSYYRINKKYDLSLSTINQAIIKHPNSSYYYYLRAATYEAMGKFDNAVNDYEKYIELSPKGFYAKSSNCVIK